MTLVKMGLMGAAVVGGLVGGAGNAKADVRVGFGPGRVTVSAPVRRYIAPPPARIVTAPVRYERYRNYDQHGRWHWDRRPIVVATAPTYTYWSYGTYNTYGDDPGYFASQINSEMAQAENDLQFDVRNGVVRPEALNQMAADQQEINRDLAAATAKGYITQDDRAHLEAHVQEIRDLRSQFRC